MRPSPIPNEHRYFFGDIGAIAPDDESGQWVIYDCIETVVWKGEEVKVVWEGEIVYLPDVHISNMIEGIAATPEQVEEFLRAKASELASISICPHRMAMAS